MRFNVSNLLVTNQHLGRLYKYTYTCAAYENSFLVPRHHFSGAEDYSIQSCPSVCPSVRVSTLLSTSLYGLQLRNPSTNLIFLLHMEKTYIGAV